MVISNVTKFKKFSFFLNFIHIDYEIVIIVVDILIIFCTCIFFSGFNIRGEIKSLFELLFFFNFNWN